MRDFIGTIYPHSTYTDISQISLAFLEFVLLKDITTTNRRVKRHLISTSSHEHGSNAESNLEQRFLRSREKSELQSNWQGPKLYSKVLAIEPNRLLSKCSELNNGAKYRLCLLIVPLLDD